jgi:hypothetical protein
MITEYKRDITNIKVSSESTFPINYKGRSLYLTLSKRNDTLYPRLFEELKVKQIKHSGIKTHKFFKTCKTIEEVENKLKQYLTQGKVDIVEDQNKYHLILYDDKSDMTTKNNNIYKEINNEVASINSLIAQQECIKKKIINVHDRLVREVQDVYDNKHNKESYYKKFKVDIIKVQENLNKLSDEMRDIKEFNDKAKITTSNINNYFAGLERACKDTAEVVKELSEKTPVIRENYKMETGLKNITSIVKLPNGYIALGGTNGIRIVDVAKMFIVYENNSHAINNLVLLQDRYIVSSSYVNSYYNLLFGSDYN